VFADVSLHRVSSVQCSMPPAKLRQYHSCRLWWYASPTQHLEKHAKNGYGTEMSGQTNDPLGRSWAATDQPGAAARACLGLIELDSNSRSLHIGNSPSTPCFLQQKQR
jgi:hypothetical protein